MFSYSHASTPLGQSEWRASYFINICIGNRYSLSFRESAQCTECDIHKDWTYQEDITFSVTLSFILTRLSDFNNEYTSLM